MSLDFAATRAAVLPSPYFERLAEIADARAVEAWEASRRAAQAPSPQRRASSRLIRQAAAWLTGSRDGADVAVDHLAAGARALARRTPPPAPEPPPAPIDADLRAEWSALAAIEPALRAEAWPLSRYFLHRPPVSILPVPYAGLMEAWPVQAQHVIVSDRPDDPMTEQLLASLLATAGARRIAVVATGHISASPLPSSAGPCLLSLTGDATGLDDTQRCAVLVRAILQRPPEALHLADSAVGRLALSRHAAALHEATRLHLHFAERDAGASTPHGRFAVFDLPRVARQVAAVSAGGPSCHHWLTEVVGLPPELVRAPSDRPAEPA